MSDDRYTCFLIKLFTSSLSRIKGMWDLVSLQLPGPWHGMAWHGMAWHGMAWHGMAWHGMAWHGMAWHAKRWWLRKADIFHMLEPQHGQYSHISQKVSTTLKSVQKQSLCPSILRCGALKLPKSAPTIKSFQLARHIDSCLCQSRFPEHFTVFFKHFGVNYMYSHPIGHRLK